MEMMLKSNETFQPLKNATNQTFSKVLKNNQFKNTHP